MYSSLYYSFLWLYSQLCWSWRRWTGQAWEVRINTTWRLAILHTCNRMVTADNAEEAARADDCTKNTVQATHVLLSSSGGVYKLQDANILFLTHGRKLLKSPVHKCRFAPISTTLLHYFISFVKCFNKL